VPAQARGWWTHAGPDTPSSAVISSPRHPSSLESAAGPAPACRDDFPKVKPWRTCSQPKLTCVWQNTGFPNHGKNHPAVCGGCQGCVPEPKSEVWSYLAGLARAEGEESLHCCLIRCAILFTSQVHRGAFTRW
jgi:hypothetical protein